MILLLCFLPVLCWGDETSQQTGGNGYSTGNQPADVTIQQQGSSEIRALRQGQFIYTTFDTSTQLFLGLYARESRLQDIEGEVKIVGSSFGWKICSSFF